MKPDGGIPVYGGNGVTGYHDEKNVDIEALVIGRVGYYCGSIHLTPANAWITDNALIVSFSEENIYKNFLFWLLKGTNLKEQENATAQPVISGRKIYPIVLAIPPLAEQHRIVAKVDELMALCDRLEAQQADVESAHAQLVQALLESLTQTSDATDFTANWQRLAEHFHTLFTTEPSIEALKQTLLQLAVMGKLVPQQEADEPATALIKRIHAEKQRLSEAGVLRKQRKLASVDEGQARYPLPIGWAWAFWDSIALKIGDIDHKMPEATSDGVPLVSPRDFYPGNIIDFDRAKRVSIEDFERLSAKIKAERGDLIYPRYGTIGENVIVDVDRDFLVSYSCAVIKVAHGYIDPMYQFYVSMSACIRKQAKAAENKTTQANVGIKSIQEYLFPVPPLAEQHRIVAKVDQLMALCDQLKTRLSQARQLNEQLASTLFESALAEDSQQAAVATDRQVAHTLLAAEITHQLHGQRTFGQRKLQKAIYLAEHAARLVTIQGDYLRDAAGPHDRHLMNQVEGELQNHQWYERIERETVGHAYRPLSQAGQHQQAYNSAWSAAERATIEQVIGLMRDWDTDRCEMTVTLYAAWNDFILEGRTVTDEAIVAEVMHRWNDTKRRFSKAEWLAVLAGMKKHEALIPTGFGNRTTGGMLTLPGLE